jgi:hypothetical protein
MCACGRLPKGGTRTPRGNLERRLARLEPFKPITILASSRDPLPATSGLCCHRCALSLGGAHPLSPLRLPAPLSALIVFLSSPPASDLFCSAPNIDTETTRCCGAWGPNLSAVCIPPGLTFSNFARFRPTAAASVSFTGVPSIWLPDVLRQPPPRGPMPEEAALGVSTSTGCEWTPTKARSQESWTKCL